MTSLAARPTPLARCEGVSQSANTCPRKRASETTSRVRVLPRPTHACAQYDRYDMARAFDLPSWRDIEECLVDAEGPDEIAMCKDDSPPVAPRQVYSALADDTIASLSSFFRRIVHGDLKVDPEECLVQAENALEQQACQA